MLTTINNKLPRKPYLKVSEEIKEKLKTEDDRQSEARSWERRSKPFARVLL